MALFYTETLVQQMSKARFLYGEQDVDGTPFTLEKYARAISRWHYNDLIKLATANRKSSVFGSGIKALDASRAWREVHARMAGAIFVANLGNAVNGDFQAISVLPLDTFPSSIMVELGLRLNRGVSGRTGNFISGGVDGIVLENMGFESAKALSAMENAKIVPNEFGEPCLDLESARRFWSGWRAYANATRHRSFTVREPTFWENMQQGARDIPDNVKRLAEGAGGLAADALVFTGETIGRTAKGFFSELGTNIIWVGGIAFLGWKYAL